MIESINFGIRHMCNLSIKFTTYILLYILLYIFHRYYNIYQTGSDKNSHLLTSGSSESKEL